MRNITLFLIGVIFFVLVIVIISAPPNRFIFRDRHGGEVRGEMNITQRGDRMDIDIWFLERDYSIDEIHITGLNSRTNRFDASIGEYRIEPRTQEEYAQESQTHLLGVSDNLDFENMTITLKKNKIGEDIKYLLECDDWDAVNFACLSEWINSTIQFTQDNESITFTTTHLSGWTGGSYMYDDFETAGVTDYCVTSNATASGWTGRVCEANSGTFKVQNLSDCFMDNKCGNLTAGGSGVRTEVYYSIPLSGSVSERVYFKTDCNNPVTVPAGATNFWIMLTSSNDTAGTGRVMLGFNQNEQLTCGGYAPNLFECSGVVRQTVSCGVWHYAELKLDFLNQNLTCYLDGVSFCSEQGERTLPPMVYVVLGKGLGSDSAVTGTIYFDEYRATGRKIGGYPNMSNLKEKRDPIYDGENQQLNATIIDLDGDLNTIWVAIADWNQDPVLKLNKTVTNHLGDEYYLDFCPRCNAIFHGQTANYSWYANDSNNQWATPIDGYFNVSNCAVPSKNLDWNVTKQCTISSDFDIGSGRLIFQGGTFTMTNNAVGIIKRLLVTAKGFFMNITNKGVFLNVTG